MPECPRIQRFACELASVIGGDRLQLSHDFVARHRTLRFQRNALARELIDHAQHPKVPSVFGPLLNEIHRPAFVRTYYDAQRNTRTARPLLALFGAHHQTFLAVDPIHPPGIDLPSFALQQHRQPAIAIPHPRRGQLLQPRAQRNLRIATWPIPQCSSRHFHQPRRTTLADSERVVHPMRGFSPAAWLYSFFEITSCRMCLSSAKSATSRLSLSFSSRS